MEPKRTKEQIVKSYENNVVLKSIGATVLIGGIVLTLVLANRAGQTTTTIVLGVSFGLALILMLFANHCPVCGSMKSPTHIEFGIINVGTGFFRCDKCNLSNPQVREYIDLLKRGVDIDKNVIARLHRRDL